MHSYLTNAEPEYIINLFEQYLKDPNAIDRSWRVFFDGLSMGADFLLELKESIQEIHHGNGNGNGSSAITQGQVPQEIYDSYKKQFFVHQLIEAYRARGHLNAKLDPLGSGKFQPVPSARIDLKEFELTEKDLGTVFTVSKAVGFPNPVNLQTVIDRLEKTYCSTIGVEYKYTDDPDIMKWLQDAMEPIENKPALAIEEKRRILQYLNEASIFENFLNTKYVGQKRFSLEGGESLIPMLDTIIELGANLGSKEFVIGMAHRGRLNVLANIMDKPYEYIFSEFEGLNPSFKGDGDVKYHMGFVSERTTKSGSKVKLSLSPNPSHLETIYPIIEGFARARVTHRYQENNSSMIPIVIHGDAAFAGQGVIMETLNMSELQGYGVGGSIHIVINNQIGFTTNARDSRATIYCSDVAKMLRIPIFHVNGDDPEAVYYVTQLAVKFRQQFKKDVLIDLVCFRRYGHNEADEPRFTQPEMYKLIDKHPNTREVYTKVLMDRGDLDEALAKEMESKYVEKLNDRLKLTKENKVKYETGKPLGDEWNSYRAAEPVDFDNSPETGVSKENLEKIIETITKLPEGFKPMRVMQKNLEARRAGFTSNAMDWGTCEALAFGSLLLEKTPVRISGQDCERGTFGHRHAVIHDSETGNKHCFLNHLGGAKFEVYNSPLSEYSVMGFEFGHSIANPNVLTIWEAQFGDFYNGAQIIVDQFLTSSESKWGLCSGLTLLLPHGYEGQGPEHSSARLERFLQNSAEYNMQVCNPTTPAQIFHLLRRQMKWPFRKPLVVMSPKSLLRKKEAVSTVEELTNGKFQEMIIDDTDPKKVKRVILCSGKVYYDLMEYKKSNNRSEVAIVRMEQLYPLIDGQISKLKDHFKKTHDYVWVQEEPMNMGAWTFMATHFPRTGINLRCISRKESASPATGYYKRHNEEQKQIIESAFEM